MLQYHTDSVSQIISPIELPKMVKVRQRFARSIIGDIPSAVRSELEQARIRGLIRPGMSIAITGSSRGIASLAVVLREIAIVLREWGAKPFIIPAMGSHGGATAEGQRRILTAHGITEENCNCPVRSTMEVKNVGETPDGQAVFIDRYAAEADGIVVVNRIKPHTDFQFTYESGLMKMMAIGLGKQYGAQQCHSRGVYCLPEQIEMFARCILEKTPIVFGVGLVENAYDELCSLRVLTAAEIPEEEPSILRTAYDAMAQIYFKDIDILIVDYIGKEISGAGADPNITGRFATGCLKAGKVKAKILTFLDVTDESDGNACGVGFADITTQRLYEKIDIDKMYPNSITSNLLLTGRIPICMKNQREAIQLAMHAACCTDPNRVRIVRIPSTASLDEIHISQALLHQADKLPQVDVLSGPENMAFDASGNLF